MYGKWILLVSGRSQGQDYGVSYLQHGLQDGSNNNEEDDGEEEGSVNDLKLDEAGLDSEDQQGDAFGHPPAQEWTCKVIKTDNQTPTDTLNKPTHTSSLTDLCIVLSFIKAL